MFREKKNPSDSGETVNQPQPDPESDPGDLMADVLRHINQLLENDDSDSDVPMARQVANSKLGLALQSLLQNSYIREVMELHLQLWLKEDPVKAWVWECYKIQEDTTCLNDLEYVAELETRLAQISPESLSKNPRELLTLLREIINAPHQFVPGSSAP